MCATRLFLSRQFALLTIGTYDISVVQMSGEISFDRIDINPAKLISLCQLFLGEPFSLILGGQHIDSCNDFVHIHGVTSYITVDDHRNTALFRLAVDGMNFDFT